MAYNILQDYTSQQTSAPQSPFSPWGNTRNWAEQQGNLASQRKQTMENIEFENRQKLYDPNFYASLFNSTQSAPSSAYAEDRYTKLMNDPSYIQNTGAYKFRLNEGQRAIERSAAAKGMTGSGNTLAALLNYGQGAAQQAYDSEAGRLLTMRGQDIGLQGQRETANLQARNQLISMLMNNAFKQ